MDTQDSSINTELSFRAPNEKSSSSSGAPNKSSESLSSGASRKNAKKYFAPLKHSKLRRKNNHNYCQGMYLITVTTTDRKPLLGSLQGSTPDEATVIPNALGELVIAAFKRIEQIAKQKTGCYVQIIQYQLMPDHFHGILYIHEQLPKEYPLGKIISGWKGACSRAYWASLLSSGASPSSSGAPNKSSESFSSGARHDSAENTPLFSPGFNDRILFHEGQLESWIEYLHDNPRRLWLKRRFPDRLRKIYEFPAGKHQHCYTAVGNTFLIKHPDRVQVRCHRNLNEQEIQAEVDYYLNLARQGSVLVSPFISPAEKAVFWACYKEKRYMIHIVNRSLDGKFVYPTGADLQACTDGFLLVLAPYGDDDEQTREVRISRSQCLNLNDFAADLST